MSSKHATWALIAIVCFFLSSGLGVDAAHTPVFDGPRAYTHLVEQCDFGPRPPGSENLNACRAYMADALDGYGWDVVFQNFTYQDVFCSNIHATYPGNHAPSLILGAHYDTRPRADKDPHPENRSEPILGANDGASGVAVLLELARVLPDEVKQGIELVFFDAEDSGDINGWDWIVGSTHYVDSLSDTRKNQISAMILLDMVGDKELRLEKEVTSTDTLQNAVWERAESMGRNDTFLPTVGARILDDHRPFLDAGIPALDIIEHAPFPDYWHTLEDTPDKCSAESLAIVGEVMEVFLVEDLASNAIFELDAFPFLQIGLVATGFAVVGMSYFWYTRRNEPQGFKTGSPSDMTYIKSKMVQSIGEAAHLSAGTS
ncbi:MAG: M28 family peptidase [Candidatus Lokiarchaeota archaeon]|nr:M28 family peptidase [Candidatus Lokiarchaeota archaeon]